MAKAALQAFIEAQAGGPCFVRDSEVTLATTPTRAVDHNFERMALIFINTGAVVVTIRPGSNVTSTSGIKLNPNGGSMTLNARDDLPLVGWEWYAIAASGTCTLAVFEVIRFALTETKEG